MKEKRVDAWGYIPQGSAKTYAMLPAGLYCNEGIRKAKKGSLVRIREGWRTEDYRLGEIVVVRTDTAVFDFFFRSIYKGWNMTREELWERWDAQMLMAGKGRNGVSRKEVLIVELLNYEETKDREE